MSKLPLKTRNRLCKEAREWDSAAEGESPEEVQKLLENAEPFESRRPVRQLVSLRMEPFDIALLKRMARRKGIPYTQLMAMWLHERIEQEKSPPAPETTFHGAITSYLRAMSRAAAVPPGRPKPLR